MTMREKMARAIDDARHAYWESHGAQPRPEMLADAALTALLSPDEGTIEATWDEFDWGPPGYDDAPGGAATPEKVLGFMASHILKEGEGR